MIQVVACYVQIMKKKRIHNYIHNLDVKGSRLICDLHINIYDWAYSIYITEFLRSR